MKVCECGRSSSVTLCSQIRGVQKRYSFQYTCNVKSWWFYLSVYAFGGSWSIWRVLGGFNVRIHLYYDIGTIAACLLAYSRHALVNYV